MTDTTDHRHVPPAPLHEIARRYSPAYGYATIAVRPDCIDLGDVADHTAGLMVVTEITRRHSTWTIGGYNPAVPYRVPSSAHHGYPRSAAWPLLTRDLNCQSRVRVRRPATAWARLPGHAKKVTSHNPVKSGFYTLIEGYDAACSCGWTSAVVCKSRGAATDAVNKHRALVLTQATRDGLDGLAAIEQLEQQVGDVLPWRWDHGAQAALQGLTPSQAVTRLTPWAEALGVGIEHVSADEFGLHGQHFLWVDPRPGNGPRLDIRAYPVGLIGAGQ